MGQGTATATSNPVGYVTENLLPGFNLIGLTLHNPTGNAGDFETEVGATLTDDQADFSNLDLSAETYILEITSGPAAGTTAFIDSATSNSITVEGGATLEAGTANYQIRPALTLDDVFGDSVLTGSFSAAAADIVFVPDGTGGYTQYFFSTTGNEFRLTSAPFAASDPVPLLYADGLLVQNRGTAKELVIAGAVKTTPTAVASIQGFNAVSVAGPVGVSLNDSNLNDFLEASFSAAAADIIWVPDGTGGFTQYFYSSTSNLWRLTSSPFAGDEGDVELPSGIFIQRRGSDTAGVFDLPAEYSSL